MLPAPHGGRARAQQYLTVVLALALVGMRALVPAFSERAFDSDQAVVGLMATHLSEFRNFPLFFYGQNYMLGVQAWIAVPFFWIGGPTVAMLRAPTVLINGGVVVALILLFVRLGMRPLLAFVATLPLIATTPVVSSALVETIGASIEPFAWVLILWALRQRPGWWGPVFCIGYLHREFVLFAAPALAAALWREGRWWPLAALGRAIAGFGAVWVAVDILKRSINLYGPPGGDHVSASLGMEVQQLLLWMSLDPGPYLERTTQVVLQALPDMMGARPYLLSTYGVLGTGGAGSRLAALALAVVLGVVIARLPVLVRQRGPGARQGALVLYLALIGLLTVFAYGLNGGIAAGDPPVVRYLLFTLWLPVALLAWFFFRERSFVVRAIVVAAMCVWAAANISDTARVLRDHIASPPANPHREVADYLVEHGIRFGRASYWDAYVVTFLAREQAIIASTGKVRISAYQTLVDQAPNAVVLTRQPCTVGEPVAAWCIQRVD